ncbi:hypothetical protein [Rubritalea tangerina]|uniref:DUF4149 domain-containing protein n=1 Tax=Rubritalea tangerina TaxID=430798 RepID=A0ABW4Z6P0_9BACT
MSEMIRLENLLMAAGFAQLGLVLMSAWIPKCLNWKGDLLSENGLMRQLFWTYASYVLGMHLFFSLLCIFAAEALMAGGVLGNALLGLMAVWWSVRIILQLCCFDRNWIPQTRFNKIAEVLLMLLFIYLAVLNGYLLGRNLLCG